jgi:hypothetical protein
VDKPEDVTSYPRINGTGYEAQVTHKRYRTYA